MLLLLIILASCKTYTIPLASLRAQFENIDSSDFKLVHISGNMGFSDTYLANPVEEIKCIDKNNNPVTLINSPSMEARITETDGKKTIFYFDRIYLNDSLLYGVRSRYIPSVRTTIPLKNIKQIEIQDGKKYFKYQ